MAIMTTNQPNNPSGCNVLGVRISAVNLSTAHKIIHQWITHRENNYVCVTGVHGVMESQRAPDLKTIHNNAGMVTPDGMPMVWLSRINGHRQVDRVYGPDLMLRICREGIKEGYKHFLYGGGEGVANKLATNLRRQFPGINIAGTHCPPFRQLTEEEDRHIVQTINDSGANIVWVGLSTPKQEYWMSNHLGRLHAPVMIGVGAAFDFHAGLVRQAPHWMQRSGLEWFYRLMTEPRRLWKRYLTNNPLFVYYLLLNRFGIRNFGLMQPHQKG